MPRRRREPEAAAPPTPEPPAPVEVGVLPEARGEVVDALGRPVSTSADILRRRSVVMQLLALGVTRSQLVGAMADQGYAITDGQARGDYDVCLREWSADYESEKGHYRAAAIRRVQSDLARLRRDAGTASGKRGPNHQARVGYLRALTAHETLLARLTGAFAPVKVQVDAHLTVRDNLVATIAGYTPEELDAMAAEQLELEGLADEARRLPR